MDQDLPPAPKLRTQRRGAIATNDNVPDEDLDIYRTWYAATRTTVPNPGFEPPLPY